MEIKKMKKTGLICRLFESVCIGALSVVAAQALDVKPGGVIFAHYEIVASQNLKDGTTNQDFSSFEVTRVQLNAEAKYDEKISGFVNFEAILSSRDPKNNRVFLKNAELRFAFNDAAKVTFGLVGIPWRALEESVWQRFTSKDLEDTEGIGNATDRGIKLSGKIPFLAYHALIVNGGGTGADGTGGNEVTNFNGGGRFKDFIGMVSIAPFETSGENLKGLKIHLMGLKGDKDETTVRNRFFAGLSYESARFKAMFNYYNADNSNYNSDPKLYSPSKAEGFSTYAYYYPTEKFWLVGRFDRFLPNIDASRPAGQNGHNRYIYGAGYQIIKGVRITLDHQYLQQDTRLSTQADESIFFLHTEAKF